jgi:hypothetical protein
MTRSRAAKAKTKRTAHENRRTKVADALEHGWAFIDKKRDSFQLYQESETLERAVVKFRGKDVTRLQIFLKMVPGPLLREHLDTFPPETWCLQAGKFFTPSLQNLYLYLAIYCRIQGLYDVSVECKHKIPSMKLENTF